MDTCTYRDNEMFLRLYADRRQIAGIFVPLSRNPLDRLATHSFMALRPFHRMIHQKRNPQASHPRQMWNSGGLLNDPVTGDRVGGIRTRIPEP